MLNSKHVNDYAKWQIGTWHSNSLYLCSEQQAHHNHPQHHSWVKKCMKGHAIKLIDWAKYLSKPLFSATRTPHTFSSWPIKKAHILKLFKPVCIGLYFYYKSTTLIIGVDKCQLFVEIENTFSQVRTSRLVTQINKCTNVNKIRLQ